MSHPLGFLEIATTLFVIDSGMAAFGIIVRYLPIFPAHEPQPSHAHDLHGSYAPLEKVRPPLGAARPRMATPVGAVVLGALSALFLIFGFLIRPHMARRPHPDGDQATGFLAAASRKLELEGKSNELKLPPDYVFPQEALSPGPVSFSHDRHVVRGAEACTNCHPKLYPMARPGTARGNFHNRRMYGCASCHDGIRAFAVDRECALCHGRERGVPSVPEDFVIPAGSNGVGSVSFSHRRHVLRARAKCSDCHPRPYEMVKPGSTFGKIRDLGKRMEHGHRCEKCHDERKAFGISADCTRCHQERGSQLLKLTTRVPR